jgi:hypothetical protein
MNSWNQTSLILVGSKLVAHTNPSLWSSYMPKSALFDIIW